MHEFSIAVGIIEIAENEAAKAVANNILSITIEVGTFSGVVPHALETALEHAKNGTRAHDAAIEIQCVDGRLRCEGCGLVFPSNEPYAVCPECRSTRSIIVTGKELKVKSIEVDTDIA